MNWIDIEIFTCKMHELARYMHVVAYYMNELHVNIWLLCIRRVNMYIYIFGEANIYLYLGSLYISRVNIFI